MSAAFTPGPWVTETNPSNTCELISAPSRPAARIAEVHSYSVRLPDKDERKANARLIAAAPELYEALLGLLKALTDDALGRSTSDHPLENAYADARAALAKARGES